MDDLKRTDSSAMKILSAYADSDEDDEMTLNLSSASKRRNTGGGAEGISSTEFTVGEIPDSDQQLPEAPESLDEDAGSQTNSKHDRSSRKSSPWSDVDDLDAADDEDHPRRRRSSTRSPKEPPPPARPDFPYSPSSRHSGARLEARSPTPAIPVKTTLLVSYNDDEELVDEQQQEGRRKSRERATVDTSDHVTNSAPNSVPSSEPADDAALDSYTLLEQSFEKVQDSPEGTASSGGVVIVDLLPPESAKKCSAKLEAKFRQYFQQKDEHRVNFNDKIQNRKDFRNPSMYEKLIEHFAIDELGTNFPKDIFNPHGFRPTDYYEELAKAQRISMDKDKNAQQQATSSATKDVGAEDKKRKSKWDNPPPSGGAQQSAVAKAAGVKSEQSSTGSGGKKAKG